MRSLSLPLVMAAALALSDTAQAQEPATANRYQSVEVTSFAAGEGLNVPQDFVIATTNQVTQKLRDTKKFAIVYLAGSGPAAPPAPVLRLTGVIKDFKAGSRSKRYLIVFGAGKTRIGAHVQFIDAATQKVVYEQDVDGKVIIGLLGGDSMGAASGLAKEVAKVTKKKFF